MATATATEAAPSRRQAIVAAARALVEERGLDALTMRRLGEALGIRAPSLYKHFPDKAAVEVALIAIALAEFADALGGALKQGGEPLAALGTAYRAYALAHPHLYRLMTDRPLPRERLPPGSEAAAAAPLLAATGDLALARAVWAFAHGLVLLELHGRFPPGADVDAAWRGGVAAFAAALPPRAAPEDSRHPTPKGARP